MESLCHCLMGETDHHHALQKTCVSRFGFIVLSFETITKRDYGWEQKGDLF